ncbi:MAG: hypothetical protein IV101_08345 [Dechloromonas sp.]|nr:hypothetical protein [Dechloromonas sp.]
MNLDHLRDQICASLALLAPPLASDAGRLVDECLENAQRSLRNEFIVQISPAAWARITLIYFKHFVDTGCDVTVAEIVAAVVRDSIQTSRMDMVTLQLVQAKLDQQATAKRPPELHVVRS